MKNIIQPTLFQMTAIHELGHACGLKHIVISVDDWYVRISRRRQYWWRWEII